jgi:hypothetical protein
LESYDVELETLQRSRGRTSSIGEDYVIELMEEEPYDGSTEVVRLRYRTLL